ncbi:MAG: histidine phosphatase family protein, partial [Actinomycetes bacterium]
MTRNDVAQRIFPQVTQRLGTFDYIASSTLLRALQTAHIISEAHGVGP